MDEQGAPQAAETGWWCRHCGKGVTLLGRPGADPSFPSLRKAVHAATGVEEGDDGHLAAPIDQELLTLRSAIELEGASR